MQVCTNDIERASLENLKCDLEEILNLTRETLNELKKPSNVGVDDGNADEDDDDDPYAQEMAIFLAEINDCEGGSGSTSKLATAGNSASSDAIRSSPSIADLEKFKVIQKFCDFFFFNLTQNIKISFSLFWSQSELETIVGKKCSAPYTFAWGARSYHNALVCGVETANVQQIHRMDDIQVTVLFTNPIHRNMVPCPFYLDGNCRFELNKCR